MPRVLLVLWTCMIALHATGALHAETGHWPHWRGPHGNGTHLESKPPIRWSDTENVRFKVPIPGRGHASPILWGDRIFVLTAVAADADAYAASQAKAAEKRQRREWPPSVDPVRQRFLVMALSRHDGSLIWQRQAADVVPHETHFISASWASASPITDGERLYAHFGSNGLYAYDLDGQLLWEADLGDMTTRSGFGEGSSPALHGDTVVINWDHEGDSFIVALDAVTGEERWRRERPGEVTSWATPLIVGDREVPQVIVPATGKSRGYDLRNGDELWWVSGMTVNTIPTPILRGSVVYLTSGYRGNMLQAIDLDKARGAVEGSEALVWSHDRHTPYVPSPVLTDGRICFVKHFRNIFTCLDAESGAVRYTEQRLPGVDEVYASPVAAGGHVYLFSREGHGVVLANSDTFQVVAENTLPEGVDASPALDADTMYVRTTHHLYALATLAETETETTTATTDEAQPTAAANEPHR